MSTKKRILAAAGDIFGKKDFSNATIRTISQAAQVNVAAINYHFKDKEGLYGAVLEDVFQKGFARFPATINKDADTDPKQRLRFFIRAMFHRLLSTEGWGGMSGQGRLIARELLDPSPAFEDILDRYIKPHKTLLVEIIAEIMQKNPGPEKLLQCAISIISQCIYYALASSVIDKIGGNDFPRQASLDQLADFVYNFSLGGITKIEQEYAQAIRCKL